MQPTLQGGERNDQLGRVSEGRIEQSADAGAQPFGECLGGATHQPGERNDGERRAREHRGPAPVRRRAERRDRDEDQEQVEDAGAAQE